MVKKLVSGVLIIVLLMLLLLASCTKTTGLPTTPITLISSSTATTPPSETTSGTGSTTPVTIADQGKIIINGQFFDFKRIDKWGDTIMVFQGVTFSPVISKNTVTGPVIYWFNARFADGTTEDLQYLLYFSDVQNDGNLSIETTKHDNPRAGIMLGHQNGRTVMYLLVSE
jgi:hypothetical protein